MVNCIVYFNGEFVLEVEVRILIFDLVLMFGDMVFEVIWIYRYELFCLDEYF